MVSREVRRCLSPLYTEHNPLHRGDRLMGNLRTTQVRKEGEQTVSSLLARLKECISSRDIRGGKRIHSHVLRGGFRSIFIETSLVDMYARCGNMLLAQQAFDKMFVCNAVAWNCLIRGYVENGETQLALEIFVGMEVSGCVPNSRTYVALVAGFAGRWIEGLRRIHSKAVVNCLCDVYVESMLIMAYGRCGSMNEARDVFESMSERDTVAWNALLQGYIENGHAEVSLELFERMSVERDTRSYVAALTACASLGEQSMNSLERSRWLEKGKAVHCEAVKNRCCDVFVENTLVNMYSVCGSLVDARCAFENMARRNTASWNALIHGYVENGESELAMELFHNMLASKCTPDSRTYVSVLTACAAMGWLLKGEEVYSHAVSHGCCNMFVKNVLLEMYIKSGRISQASTIFDNMSHRDIVSWNCLAQGYVENGQAGNALEMVARMPTRSVVTLVTALTACGKLMDFGTGHKLRMEIENSGYEFDVSVATCLIEFYSKCGCMESARQVFDKVPKGKKNILTWTSLMCGYSLHGDTENVFELFEKLQNTNLTPNEVTFICLLSACNHKGLTEKGLEYFNLMTSTYDIHPSLMHYACVIDMLARANKIEEAVHMLEHMPFKPDRVIWSAVLSACRKWDNVYYAKVAYESLMKIDERDPATYVLMGNICATHETSKGVK